MDSEELIRDVVDRVRNVIAEAEEAAAQIIRDAETDAKQIRADADVQARQRLDQVREVLARLESTIGSETAPEPDAEVKSGPDETSEPERDPMPEQAPPADSADRPSTEELIERLKASSD